MQNYDIRNALGVLCNTTRLTLLLFQSGICLYYSRHCVILIIKYPCVFVFIFSVSTKHPTCLSQLLVRVHLKHICRAILINTVMETENAIYEGGRIFK